MQRLRAFLASVALAAGLIAAPVAHAQSATAAPESVPRMPDGKPDLNGTWDNGSGIDFLRPEKTEDGSICLMGCTPRTGPRPPPPKPDRPVYKPEFAAKVADLERRQVEMDPVLRCRNPGLPRIGPPDKIVQRPGEIVFLYDDVSGSFWRIIPTDGRPHRADADESYLGDSVGHWEGDTLVIEARNFNEDTWLTDDGAFHTKDLVVIERLRRVGDTIEWRATAHDPQVLAQPWELRPRIMTLSKTELLEPPACVERDLKHVVDGTHHDNPR